MIFIREKHQPRRDIQRFQCAVVHKTLRIRHAVIERTVDHQRRCFHVFGERGRILRGDLVRIIPVRCFQRVRQPVACVARVDRHPIETSRVTNVRLVSITALLRTIAAIHPRDHFAAIAAAGRSHPLGIDVTLLQHEIGGGLHVRVFLGAPGAVVGFGERIAPALRAVIVHAHHHVTRRGEDMVVPAHVKIVAPVGVRPAMDVVHQRPLFLRVEVRRIHHPHLHRIEVPAFDGEFAHLAQLDLRHHRVVEIFDRACVFAVGLGGKHLGGRGHVVAHKAERIRFHIEFTDGAAFRNIDRFFRAAREPPDADTGMLVGGEIHALAVGRPA